MEADLMRKIQIAISTLGARVFRNNVALAWAGKVQRFTERTNVIVNPGDVVVRNARPIHAGLIDGASDLIGWSSTGKFMACEVKTESGKLSDEQINFLMAVHSAGGIAIIARSPEEALDKIQKGTGDGKFIGL